MKKFLSILAIVGVFVALPVLAVESAEDNTQPTTRTTTKTRTSYEDTANGIKERVQDLKQEREETKEQKREEIGEATKKVATKRIDIIIKRYQSIQNRVSKMTVLTEEQKTSINAKIATEINKLNALKTELNSATDIAQVKVIMEKVKLQVRASKLVVKEIVLDIHLNHYANIHSRLTTVYDKLSSTINTLKSEGKDTTKLEADLAVVKATLDNAKKAIDEKNLGSAKVTLLEAKKQLVKLNKDIKVVADSFPERDSAAETPETNQ